MSIYYEVESVFEQYLKAFEEMDREKMNDLWSHADQDRVVSIYGQYESFPEIMDQYYQLVLSRQYESLQIFSSSFEIITATDTVVLANAFYELAITQKKSRQAPIARIWETQEYVKTPEGWKLHYIHQSLQPKTPQSEQDRLIQEYLGHMIDFLSESPAAHPKSTRELARIHASLLKNHAGELFSPEYKKIENLYFSELKKQLLLTPVAALLEKDEKAVVWKGRMSSLVADVYISFVSEDDFYDYDLSPLAGSDFVHSNQEMSQDPSGLKVWSVPGEYLPARTVIEIALPVVYGLYTPKQASLLKESLNQAMNLAIRMEARTIAISFGWHSLLHIPTQSGSRMICSLVNQAIRNDPDLSVILCTDSAKMARSMRYDLLESKENG